MSQWLLFQPSQNSFHDECFNNKQEKTCNDWKLTLKQTMNTIISSGHTAIVSNTAFILHHNVLHRQNVTFFISHSFLFTTLKQILWINVLSDFKLFLYTCVWLISRLDSFFNLCVFQYLLYCWCFFLCVMVCDNKIVSQTNS